MCSTNGECECGTLSRCNSFLLNSPCVSFLYSACICGIWKFDCIGLLEWQLKMACIIHWGTKIQCHIEFMELKYIQLMITACELLCQCVYVLTGKKAVTAVKSPLWAGQWIQAVSGSVYSSPCAGMTAAVSSSALQTWHPTNWYKYMVQMS